MGKTNPNVESVNLISENLEKRPNSTNISILARFLAGVLSYLCSMEVAGKP
jgi:hypothetical protein